jgi:hypothetical protein
MYLEEFPWKEFENLFEINFMDRTINVGSISAEQAISYSLQVLTCVQVLITMYVSHNPIVLTKILIL